MPTPTPDSYPGTPGTVLYAGQLTPEDGALISAFDLTNWSGSTTKVLHRAGMPFKKGDIPSGSVPEIRRGGTPIDAQFDERTTWSDGSLKFAVCHMRDSDLSGSATYSYEIYSVTGSYNNTGTASLASVAAANTLTVEISSFTESNGGAPTTRGSGAALADFSTHAAVATRVTKIHSGPVCDGWQVWGMAKDGSTGAGDEDAHLKSIWYVDVWKDGSSAIIDTEYGAVLSQDWWGVANKRRLAYTATLKRSGATTQAYTGVTHPCQSQMMTARMTDDSNHGKRHWVTAVPTLVYKPDKEYWVSSGMAVPLDPAFTPDANTSVTYVPFGNMQHRADINGTGAYMGRGMWPNCDSATFMRQTAADVRSSRANAFAGLSFPAHYRDERTRTRSSESADVANTLIPLIWSPSASGASTFTGLPTPKDAYNGSGTDSGKFGGWEDVTGGIGVWSTGSSIGDSSHAVNFSGFMYMLEGERYFLEATIDMATKGTQGINGNFYGACPTVHWYENTYARSEMSIPSTEWGALPNYREQPRSIGWATLLVGNAAGLIPDNDPMSPYLRGWNDHCGDYLAACNQYTPTSLKPLGICYLSNPEMSGATSPWMNGFVAQGCYQNLRMTENEPIRDYAELMAQGINNLYQRDKYETTAYRVCLSAINADYSGTNPYVGSLDYLMPNDCSVSSNKVTVSGLYYDPQNGDEVYFINYESASLPVGYVEGTRYYAINQSGLTFDVSETLGGAAVPVPDGSYKIGGAWHRGSGMSVAAFPPYLPNADSYSPIAMASLVYAEAEACPNVTPGTSAAMQTFLSGVAQGEWPAWKLAVPA